MKKLILPFFIVLVSILAGCGGGKKQEVAKKPTETIEIPLGETKKESTMLSFFEDDVNAFEDVETFVLDEESSIKEDQPKMAQADGKENESVDLQEPTQQVDKDMRVVYFDYDSNEMRNDQKETMKSLKKDIKAWTKKGYKIVFRGHACRWSPQGDSIYNMVRSNERADTLAESLGVAENKRLVLGLGYEEPIIIEDKLTKEGQAPNRRVEIYPIAA